MSCKPPNETQGLPNPLNPKITKLDGSSEQSWYSGLLDSNNISDHLMKIPQGQFYVLQK